MKDIMLILRCSILLIFLSTFCANGQIAWTWTPLNDMPFATSNNAVSEGKISGESYIFSFGGIDTTKIWSGIHKRAFRYNVNANSWDEIDTLPVTLPLIASSANTVKNKIYIIGGYHVYSNGNETSSNEVIIYNPETNTYEGNGTPIPTPIDDQTQCVYKDSLIYVISGWSNTGNVTNVQIYNPSLDQWQAGTPVPNSSEYKVFGSSGQIIGDTIYYYGGASTGFNFPAQWKLRKGIIDPNDPSQISWSIEEDAPNRNYRSACLAHGNNIFWVGGTATSYNYNGIAYNGSGGVEPLYNIARYDGFHHHWHEGTGAPYGVMDLRGNGQISSTEWVVCGGMADGQTVSDKAYLLTYDPVVGSIENLPSVEFKIVNHQIYFDGLVSDITIYTMEGKLAQKVNGNLISDNLNGLFILSFKSGGTTYRHKVLIQ
ncbi:hypothetical protein K6119_08895 [Paracrocinitomix mangrovi]|uniref:Kelch repeat-containing protein n=1 Tax=Paracrocinitomix mangrovi TaxID=2862509 RepID=UPI001C8D207C|nr:hypothetical protein [Paracrocinitomix mangrovi]UKN03628.1 hypothetical protein K6119_08895 [Paracrocinitomix mangrovi]